MRKYNIASDLVQVKPIEPVVYKQYDKGDTLEIELYQDGEKIDLTDEIILAFFELENGVVIQKTCEVKDGNALAELDNNILSISGRVKVEFTIYREGEETTTRTLLISVEKSINRNEAVETVPQWDIVDQLIVNGPLILKDVQDATTEAELWVFNAENAVQEVNIVKDQAQEKVDYVAEKEPLIEQSILDAAEAKSVSADAKVTAETVRDQFDQVVAEAGSNNPEVVQARGGKTNLNERLDEFTNALSETARQTTTLSTGVAVVNGGTDALSDAEIEGRTLVNVSNSNLEASKQYVLADKKSKVIVDGVTVNGVGKFTKGTTTVTTADYVGKVAGSTVANPHLARAVVSGTGLTTPSTTENFGAAYTAVSTLNGALLTNSNATNGGNAQHIYSFNIIEQIERTLGIIPKSTLAEKVQWVKDNVEKLTANWHGFGSSVGGNKATLVLWRSDLNNWNTTTFTHSLSTVSKLSIPTTSLPLYVGTDGYIHTLAYAEASDGATASSISTDFINLEITLKATAQLITRPKIIRVENFEGKVSGSTVENPHEIKTNTNISTTGLFVPSSTSWQSPTVQATYTYVSKLGDTPLSAPTVTVNGTQAQQLFSFNLIEAVERNIGRIPASDVAGKVAWLKANVAKLTVNWHGFGSSVGGNKANLAQWNGSWVGLTFHTNSTVARASTIATNGGSTINSITDGFVHFLAYAEASDGTTASVINTDYIDLEIELKQDAQFVSPRIPLYEVTATEYNNILTTWNESEVLSLYPSVEGVQHLQGVGVVAEGENLLPPFTEWGTIHPNAKVVSPYELELTINGTNQVSYVELKTIKNTNYAISMEHTGKFGVFAENGTVIIASYVTGSTLTFNSGKYDILRVYLNSPGTFTTGTFTFKNPMLTLGSTPKPFVPRNPSYLYADVKLGAIGSVADRLYKQDGRWLLRKSVEKDVVLDGSLTWSFFSDSIGFKALMFPNLLGSIASSSNLSVIANTGKLLKSMIVSQQAFADTAAIAIVNTVITVSDTDTGFAEAYTPTASDIKRYFNGWKYVDGTTWNSVTGNGQTATAQVALDTKPSDYTPYKLSHVLATPQTIDVTDKVEGALKVNGLTQLEVLSGVVRREKANPVKGTGTGLNSSLGVAVNKSYYINSNQSTVSMYEVPNGSQLKNKVSKVLRVYKNGVLDNSWIFYSSSSSNGMYTIATKEENFDPTAEYTVTYIALDKQKITANPTNVKLMYANNIRSSLEDAVGEIQDNKAQISVHVNAIAELYKRVKALGG